MKVFFIVLLAVAIGAGAGFAGGLLFTVFQRIQTDMKLACTLLEAAEAAGYIGKDQRSDLVDEVVPPKAQNPQGRPDADWIRRLGDAWWEGIRDDQKSGCAGV